MSVSRSGSLPEQSTAGAAKSRETYSYVINTISPAARIDLVGSVNRIANTTVETRIIEPRKMRLI